MLVASLVLSALGIAVAGYLTLVHYQDDLLVCGAGGGCHTVQNSEYAVVAGVPIALAGVVMYVLLVGLAVLRWSRPKTYDRATMAAFLVALGGVAYAGYLTYVELFVLEAICQWCVSSAVLTVAICVIEGIGVWHILGRVDHG